MAANDVAAVSAAGDAPKPRVLAPANAVKGEVFLVKALIQHQMETGLRHDEQGAVIPRKIINRFVCRYGDREVFGVDFNESVAANPYLEFYLRATDSDALEFIWEEDGGGVFRLNHYLTVGRG